MGAFLLGYVCGGLSIIALFVWLMAKDTPRACREGCGLNTWSESGVCSVCELDEYEEEHGKGARPGR